MNWSAQPIDHAHFMEVFSNVMKTNNYVIVENVEY
jgi:hypothetical protein